MCTGFIFDCDGTLLDSMPVWTKITSELAKLCGGDLDDQDIDIFYSAPATEVAEHLHRKYGAAAVPEKVLYLVSEVAQDFYEQHVCLKPGAADFVYALCNEGITCAVLSASPQKYLRAGLRRVGLYDCFAAVLSVDDVGIAKRNPIIYRHTCQEIGVDLHGAWGVDDSLFAISAMQEAGLATIGVFDAYNHTDFAQLKSIADIAIYDFKELDIARFCQSRP